jgi:1-acyl-sn-glycerol-3-phosphate acyltransferase
MAEGLNADQWSIYIVRVRFVLFPFFAPLMILVTLIIAPLVTLFALLGRQAVAYRLVQAWCWVLALLGRVRYTVSGLENLPADGAYVIVSNHCSHYDGPTLILVLPHDFYFVIKRELTRVPLWGQAVVKLGYIAIDRGQSDKARAQMTAAAEVVRTGRRVLVFAEGTRSRQQTMLPFKKGAFHLAIDAGVPILPVAVNNSRNILPKGSLFPKPGTIEWVVGDPISTSGLSKDDVPVLLDQTRQAIQAMRSPAVVE